MNTQAKVTAALEQFDNVVRTGLGTSRTEDMLADALKAVLAEKAEAAVGVNRPVLEGTIHALLLTDRYGEAAPHWSDFAPDGEFALLARRIGGAVEAGAAGRDIHAANSDVVNPILRDAIIYHNERRGMANPKGWAHVLRVVKDAIAKGVYSGRVTPSQVDVALKALDELVAAEDSGQTF